jgi:hypothetical protein
MKKIFLLLFSALAFVACEGPQGPPGFNGFNGEDIVAESFEVELDFFAPNFSQQISYPSSINVFETDMTLVYILFDQDNDGQGNPLDIWRLLPQTLYSDFGEYQYNYDFTNLDVRIFLDGPPSTNFEFFGPADLSNQIFRVVILPVALANNPGIDVTDYESVMQLGGMDAGDVIRIE